MKKITFIFLLLLAGSLAMGQSWLKRGFKVGNAGGEIVVDSIIEENGATRIYYNGVPYDAVNADSAITEESVNGTEPLIIWNGYGFTKTTADALTATTQSDVSTLQTGLSDLETTVENLDLSSDFDSLVLSEDLTKVYGYVTLPIGQLRVVLNVDSREDNISPTFVSAEVGNYNSSVIVVTMSEFLLSDSIYEYSGAAGGNFPELLAAYNFNETSGDLIDRIGIDDGTLYGPHQGDSAGIANFGYYLDGSDYITLGTYDWGSDDISGSVWIKPLSLGSDFRVYSGSTNGFFIWYDAANDGIACGKSSVDISTTTDIDLNVNEWNHIAWYHNGTNCKFWINGVDETEPFVYTFSSATYYIGSSATPSSYFNGIMDDLFLFDNYAMTDNRADSLYNSGVGRRYNESGGGVSINSDTITEAFAVTIDPDIPGFDVDSVWSLGTKVYLNLTDAVTYGDVVTVAYTRPTGDGSVFGLRDTSDNYASSWTSKSVTNNIDTVEFEIYETFDFETETLGEWTLGEQQSYFNLEDPTPDWYDLVDIDTSTIDGLQSKVLRFELPAGQLYGYEASILFDGDYDEVYLAYRYKYSSNFDWTDGGKMTGFGGTPNADWPFNSPMLSYEGWSSSFIFKQGGRLFSYQRDRTYSWVPWSIEEEDFVNPFYINNGSWMYVVRRAKMNTFTGGVANADGIIETWVNNVMIHQKADMKFIVTEGNAGVDRLLVYAFYGGDFDIYRPDVTCYTYIDSIVLFKPLNDPTWGTTDLHETDEVFVSPIDISDMSAVYNTLVTTETTVANSEYGGTYSRLINECWLIQAGEGETVTLTMNGGSLGNGDYIIIQDGKNANDDVLGVIENSTSNLTTQLGGDGAVTSTGRWMLVTFRTNRDDNANGFTSTITFD